ncbi:hypothetical protein RND81_11G120200 [Saponaria officinalis]|uniref:Uncharacterized protein n=1 Tax=Saponaria officinalis TaxID=3572 RepID=A0AAW1HL17_SAPOF
MEFSEENRIIDGNKEDEEEKIHNNRKKGGFITMPFILANEAFERVASFGLMPNMIIYLMSDYKMSVTKAQNLLYMWNTANSFTPFAGALLADTLLGRFLTIGIGSIFSLLGMFVMFLTTVIPHAKPAACDPKAQNCQSTTAGQYAFLVLAFVLMSIGTGGIRPCSQVFGADQVEQGDPDNPKNKNALEIFLNWYYMFSSLSIIISLTVIVYIQVHLGWRIGFGIPLILMFLATISFFLASPLYLMVKCNKRLLVGFAQVVVAIFRNRNLDLSGLGSNVQYYYGKDDVECLPSDRLRFMNKACTIQDPEKDIGPDGEPTNPWRLSKVKDVEGIKSFVRLIPIWSTGIMITVNTSTSSFALLLTRTMDRHIGSFEVPAASFGTFLIVVIVIWIPLYDRVLLPLASKICGRPVRLSVKLRMGIGLFFAFVSMLVSGIVETIRRRRAIDEGFENNPLAVLHMSALWTLLHSLFFGLAEAFFVIAQFELFYNELPKDMLSIAGSIYGLSGTFGSLIATLILNTTNSVTKKGGSDGWIATNVNKGHYDYFYYMLAVLNVFNVVWFIFCSWLYGPVGQRSKEVAAVEKNHQELNVLKSTNEEEEEKEKEKDDSKDNSNVSKLE